MTILGSIVRSSNCYSQALKHLDNGEEACYTGGMRCSPDLRKRVIDFVRGGGSKTETAWRFQVSRASVYNWANAPNGLAYQRPGPKGPRRLDW